MFFVPFVLALCYLEELRVIYKSEVLCCSPSERARIPGSTLRMGAWVGVKERMMEEV